VGAVAVRLKVRFSHIDRTGAPPSKVRVFSDIFSVAKPKSATSLNKYTITIYYKLGIVMHRRCKKLN
jgi:hypothetical protein